LFFSFLGIGAGRIEDAILVEARAPILGSWAGAIIHRFARQAFEMRFLERVRD